MTMTTKIIVALLILGTAGVATWIAVEHYERQRALDAVASQLVDPNSAQFRNVKGQRGNICGEVNGKNRMGGYVGFKPFYVQYGRVDFGPSNADDHDPAASLEYLAALEDWYEERSKVCSAT